MFKLQSNVPLPRTIRPTAKGRRRKYPFEQMRVDDFFFVPGKTRQQVYGHVWQVGKDLDRKFSTRVCYMRKEGKDWQLCKQDEPGATLGVGVWRTS